MKRTLGMIAAVAAVWALPAQAQMVKAQEPESVVHALQQAGYAAKLGADDTGDPMISSGVDGSQFKVFFYNCTDHEQCATVQFHIGFDLKENIGLARINEWNRTQRFGRAYLDAENDPILQMDVDLDDGGLSMALFTDNLEFWSSVVGKFKGHIGFK